ncbi:MAG TPA: hypothetical protein VIH47_02980 [Solirubrobacterales bacterium]
MAALLGILESAIFILVVVSLIRLRRGDRWTGGRLGLQPPLRHRPILFAEIPPPGRRERAGQDLLYDGQ